MYYIEEVNGVPQRQTQHANGRALSYWEAYYSDAQPRVRKNKSQELVRKKRQRTKALHKALQRRLEVDLLPLAKKMVNVLKKVRWRAWAGGSWVVDELWARAAAALF